MIQKKLKNMFLYNVQNQFLKNFITNTIIIESKVNIYLQLSLFIRFLYQKQYKDVEKI